MHGRIEAQQLFKTYRCAAVLYQREIRRAQATYRCGIICSQRCKQSAGDRGIVHTHVPHCPGRFARSVGGASSGLSGQGYLG